MVAEPYAPMSHRSSAPLLSFLLVTVTPALKAHHASDAAPRQAQHSAIPWQRAGFDGAKSASTYAAPAKIDIWEYDSPSDPKFSAMVPSGFGEDRPLFNPDEPPYEVEKESVRLHLILTFFSGCCSHAATNGHVCF